MTLHTPIRVFLLSGSRFLGEGLGRVLRKTADIVVVGTRPYSANAPLEISKSRCEVLVTDSVSVLGLDSQIANNRRRSLSHLKVVMIEMDDNIPTPSRLARIRILRRLLKEAAVADVISTIRCVAKGDGIHPSRPHLVGGLMGVSTPGHSDL
jgi:DNA-binding NarL/FixJ family response regulator